ncbi:MAG TPA: nitrite reductase small subunit NirD [Burkholderiales bacterium]|nr:nitrite reductase small subunit NirD [Burkholderiales bacterium]
MRICRVDEILDNSGVCALVGGEQVAVFRVDGMIYAIGNRDPFSGANVLSRGIVGDIDGEPVVASPVYKQHFSLLTGRCLEDPSVSVPVYRTRVDGSEIQIL